MTFRELQESLSKLSAEQLDQTVTTSENGRDFYVVVGVEVTPADDVEPAGTVYLSQ